MRLLAEVGDGHTVAGMDRLEERTWPGSDQLGQALVDLTAVALQFPWAEEAHVLDVVMWDLELDESDEGVSHSLVRLGAEIVARDPHPLPMIAYLQHPHRTAPASAEALRWAIAHVARCERP